MLFTLKHGLTAFVLLYAVISATSQAEESEKDYSYLAGLICGLFETSRDLTKDARRAMINYIKKYEVDAQGNPLYTGRPDLTNEEIISFLNLNKQRMYCRDGGTHINYIHYAIKKSLHSELIDQLFYGTLYSEKVKIDFNAISIGFNFKTERWEPMTVLDYLVYGVSLDPAVDQATKNEVAGLVEIIADKEEFGGLQFDQLPESVQAEWNAFFATDVVN